MKPRLVLERYYMPVQGWGTFGRLIVGDAVLFTVEQPWEGNKPFKSCIPEGEYDLAWHQSPKYGRRLHIVGGTVALTEAEMHASTGKTRYACLLHPANWAKQLQGCIAPGMAAGIMSDLPAVQDSARALGLIEAQCRDGAHLTILPFRAAHP